MNRIPFNQARVLCHTPWQRPLSLLLVIGFCLLSATLPVAAEQPQAVPVFIATANVAIVDTADAYKLNDAELGEVRGRHLEAAPVSATGSTETAIILWDEIKSGSNRGQYQQTGGSHNSQVNSIVYSR